jgi:hypothetical protein
LGTLEPNHISTKLFPKTNNKMGSSCLTKSTRRENTLKGLLNKEGRCIPCVVWVVDENSMVVCWMDGYLECLVVNTLVEPKRNWVG